MSFSVMFDILKKKEKNRIVFVQCGHFYLAIGEDAVLLHERLGLKCTCFKNQMCKVGIPVGSLEKYLEKINKIDVLLNCQRIYLRIMYDNFWVDDKKFNIAMQYIYEIGKIVGGLTKYYAKNN